MRKQAAFTLIDLLSAAVIIAILAAIAAPNYLGAQSRSKILRVKSDLRALSTALESYEIDCGKYPPTLYPGQLEPNLFRLTTPTPYIPSVSLKCPFEKRSAYMYMCYEPEVRGDWANSFLISWRAWLDTSPGCGPGEKGHRAYVLTSPGPDRRDTSIWIADWCVPQWAVIYINDLYDPTNGTVSPGAIARAGGAIKGFQVLPVGN